MYQHVLAVVDLSNASAAVIGRAWQLALLNEARLTVVHVAVGRVTGYGTGGHIASEIEIKQQLFPRIKQLIADAGANDAELCLLFGRPADMIKLYAQEHHCDLIVTGSHGYGGVRALLGSTTNAIIHGASCDVYCVRIKD
jgi:universal stress protein A